MSNVIAYKGYHGSIEFCEEDGMLIGSVIGVRDSLNFHGFSVDEITESFHNCIDDYLEMCAALGRSPDKEYKGSFNVRVTPQIHRNADLAARKTGISLNQFVQDAIEEKINKQLSEQPAFFAFIDSARIETAVTNLAVRKDRYSAELVSV